MPQPIHQGKPHSDLRLRENRDDSNHEEQEHLTKAGEPDHRYKENREGNKDSGKHIEDGQFERLEEIILLLLLQIPSIWRIFRRRRTERPTCATPRAEKLSLLD